MNDTQFQIDHLIELAVLQRAELKTLVDSMPELRDYLSEEIERNLEAAEPAIRSELEQLVIARAKDAHAESSATLNAKIEELANALEITTAAKYSVLMAERAQNATLLAQAEARIAEAASALPGSVKGIVTDELARFPRAGEIDQLRKEFAEPRGLNPRGRWQVGETYNKLDLVSYNGDSYVSNTDGNREKPSRSSEAWTLSAARGNGGAGGGVTSLTDLVAVPANGELLIGNGSAFVNNTITGGTGVTVTNGPGTITIDASGAQEILTATVTNAESFAITRGQVVYLFGATGNRASVKLADNTNDAASSKTFGIVSQASISAGGNGLITCVGQVNQLTLGTYTEGDVLYLDATPGAFTNVKPYAPNHLVYVGMVERANNGNGEMYVRIQNGFEIEELHNVQIITPPLAGSLLMRDATTSLWKANRLTGTANQVTVTNADTSVTLSLPTAIANVNSVTAATTQNLTLAGGSSGSTLALGQGTNGVATLSTTLTTTDVTLGTSGPSVKSSLAARAARQGLVFNGTSVATATMTTAKSLAFTFNATSDSDILGLGWANGSIRTSVSSGNLKIETNNPYAIYSTPVTLGKTYHVVYVGVSGSPLLVYLNGILVITGSSNLAADITANTGNLIRYGANHVEAASFIGTISNPLLYNRALSATEVVSLYESGVPSGADYNTASNTALNNNTFLNIDFTTFTSASSTGFTATNTSGAFKYAKSAGVFSIATGQRFRVRYTLSGTFTNLRVELAEAGVAGKSTFAALSAGTNELTLVATGATANGVLQIFSNGSADNFTLSNVIIDRPGLLLAPDAAQAGGGLAWYDTSGNAANITLPASGVTWNVPTSGYFTAPAATNLTLAGGSTGASLVLGQGASGNATLTPTGTGGVGVGNISPIQKLDVAGVTGGPSTSGTSADGAFRLSAGAFNMVLDMGVNHAVSTWIQARDKTGYGTSYNLSLQPRGGNLLIGTTTDSGNGKLQLATHTTSAGGIGFGTDTSLYRYQSGGLAIDATGNVPALMLRQSGTNALFAYTSSLVGYIGTPGAYSLNLQTNNITALTLASNQAATFAGAVTAGGDVVASASASGTIREIAVVNTATAAGSDARMRIRSGVSSSTTVGDAFVQFTDSLNFNWSIGAGSTGSRTLIFAEHYTLGTNERMRLSSSGLAVTGTVSTTGAATFGGTVISPAATTAISSVRLPHGTAPTSPVNGDMWTTTAGLYVRINGVTVGPLS